MSISKKSISKKKQLFWEFGRAATPKTVRLESGTVFRQLSQVAVLDKDRLVRYTCSVDRARGSLNKRARAMDRKGLAPVAEVDRIRVGIDQNLKPTPVMGVWCELNSLTPDDVLGFVLSGAGGFAPEIRADAVRAYASARRRVCRGCALDG